MGFVVGGTGDVTGWLSLDGTSPHWTVEPPT